MTLTSYPTKFLIKHVVLAVLTACFFLPLASFAQNRNGERLVMDNAGILNNGEVQQLERKLVAYDDSTSIQIAIFTEGSHGDADVFDRSLDIAESLGIGQEGRDNGILLYIAQQERQVRIQTGPGASTFLPDNMAKRVIDQIIVPAFRSGDFYGGLDKGTDVIMQLGQGEYDAMDRKSEGGGIPILFFIILFIIIIIILSSFGGGDDGGYHRGGRYDSSGRWIFFPGGGSHRGWNSGGGSGGFGGGGFGGFGGGGFDGGGAGGSW